MSFSVLRQAPVLVLTVTLAQIPTSANADSYDDKLLLGDGLNGYNGSLSGYTYNYDLIAGGHDFHEDPDLGDVLIHNNYLTITGSAHVSAALVTAGWGDFGYSEDNHLTVSGNARIESEAAGAHSYRTAHDNTLLVTDNAQVDYAIGGYANHANNRGSAYTYNNTVTISGNGRVNYHAAGGYTRDYSASSYNNTVNLYDNAYVAGFVSGGSSGTDGVSSYIGQNHGPGNSINVSGNVTAGAITNYDTLNITITSQNQSTAALTLLGGTMDLGWHGTLSLTSDISGKTINIIGASGLDLNHRYTIMSSSNGFTISNSTIHASGAFASRTYTINGSVTLYNWYTDSSEIFGNNPLSQEALQLNVQSGNTGNNAVLGVGGGNYTTKTKIIINGFSGVNA